MRIKTARANEAQRPQASWFGQLGEEKRVRTSTECRWRPIGPAEGRAIRSLATTCSEAGGFLAPSHVLGPAGDPSGGSRSWAVDSALMRLDRWLERELRQERGGRFWYAAWQRLASVTVAARTTGGF